MIFNNKTITVKPALAMAFAALVGVSACKNETNAAEATDTGAKPTSETKSATENSAGNDRVATIGKNLVRGRPDLKVTAVEATEVKGVEKVQIDGRGTIYAIQDGNYFFVGDLYRVDEGALVNVTEEGKNGEREQLLASLKKDDMIVFSPKGEVKASISVFTDVDCGYCQKLHQEVPAMNDMGIEIRYLAFPRAGIGSPSYEKIASAWCADNKQDALTKLKQREPIPTNVCDGNPVADQLHIGQQMGVTGTPSLILDNGEMIPGYLPAQQLADRLGVL